LQGPVAAKLGAHKVISSFAFKEPHLAAGSGSATLALRLSAKTIVIKLMRPRTDAFFRREISMETAGNGMDAIPQRVIPQCIIPPGLGPLAPFPSVAEP
jgi:hypothetical protein